MRFIVCRSWGPGSIFLRTVLRSRWSHVAAIVDETETCISAEPWHGVIEKPLAELINDSSEHEIIDIYVPDYAAAVAWSRSQVGKGYDWTGLLGVAAGSRRWQDDDNWFCSEEAEATVLAGGRQRWATDLYRVTPQDFYMAAR